MKKRAGENTTDGIIQPKRQRTSYVSHKELTRLRNIADGKQTQSLVEVTEANYDPWDLQKDIEEATQDPRFSFLEKSKKKVAPPTLKHKPISLAASGKSIPAVKRPEGGYSYNPMYEDYEDRLVTEGEKELAAEAKRLADPLGSKYAMVEDSAGTPYCDVRWMGFFSPLEVPCTPPPWGTIAGIDLQKGEVAWQVPLGTTRDLAPFPFWFIDGVPNMGGPITTASGLTFIAATSDYFLRAFDSDTGVELWKGRLPTGGQATPMTYRAGPADRQYVVIAAGGHWALGTPASDHIIAFALPE